MKKELKRMSRGELLELLITQIEENEKLASELEECRKKLSQKEITMESVGSLAEAALKLNDIFEAADAAVEQYVGSVKSMSASEKPAESVFAETGKSPELLPSDIKELEAAKSEAEAIIIVAKAQADKIMRDADNYMEETMKKVKALLDI